MSLSEWEAKGWVLRSVVDKESIFELLENVEADLSDARRDLSVEWTFGISLEAVINLCRVLVLGAGYRIGNDDDYNLAINSLPIILGSERSKDARYLEACCVLRQNRSVSPISPKQAEALLQFAEDFYLEVLEWLRNANPKLVVHSSITAAVQEDDWMAAL